MEEITSKVYFFHLHSLKQVILKKGFILGYRYELYCSSKSNKTTQCTLHIDTSSEQAWKQNLKREENCQYSQENFDALIMRYEAPDGRNRWDTPLFTIQPEDKLPFEEIAAALCERKAPAPNQSTQSVNIQHLFWSSVISFTFSMFFSFLSHQQTSSMSWIV